jgi:Beta-propeller repeat/Viral BACON domain
LKTSLFLIISCLPLFSEATKTQARDAFAKLPLSFEENKGQTDSQVKYLTRGPGFILYLTGNEIVLMGQDASSGVFRMKLERANQHAKVEPLDKLPGFTNYFIGNDPSQWRTHVANYGKVAVRDIYPGIDLIVYGDQRQLEYDLAVAPGADPNRIRVKFEGAESMQPQSNGDMVIRVDGTEIVQRKPVIYQMIGGQRRLVDGHFALRGKNQMAFEVARYDARKPLVIDPAVLVGTYLGGSATDQANAIAVSFDGIYVTGSTNSPNFPNNNAFHANFSGGAMDAFVTKLNANGTAIVYSTYLGGTNTDSGQGIAVDAQGSAYVTGSTSSANFPLSTTVQSLYAGNGDAFVVKVNPAGDGLTYSTYLGGSGQDKGTGIAIDANGNAYVTGSTTGSFPLFAAMQTTFGGGTSDGFVAAISAGGNKLLYSTYVGGTGNDFSNAIAADSAGNVFITGSTTGSFPTLNASQSAFGGGASDAFVAALTSTGSLFYSTYLGGAGVDSGQGIAIDSNDSAYVTGSTSGAFPLLGAIQSSFGGGTSDAFISQLSQTGVVLFSTYLGGAGADSGNAIAVDSGGAIYLTGSTTSIDFPVVNGLQTNVAGAFVAKLTGTSHAYVYSSFVGGGQTDSGTGIAALSGQAYVTGYTSGGLFVANAAQAAFGGGPFDAFVLVLSDANIPVCTFTLSPVSPVTFQIGGGSGSINLQASFNNCSWSASSNIDWITNVSPFGTGSGTVLFTVAQNNTGATRTGTISVAGQSYTIIQNGTVDNTPPFGAFETPVNGAANIVGAIPVTGWALDNVGVAKVDIYRDPVSGETPGNFGLVFIGTATFVAGARPDVQSTFPTYPNANRAGWGYQLLTNFLPSSGNGTFRLHAFATDTSGNVTELNSPSSSSVIGATITVTNSTATIPFGTIDTPAPGDTISGTNYVNFAWALTPQPNIIPVDGSTIFVVIDGVVQPGHPTYGQFRNDIATLFPTYKNSLTGVGFYRFNTALLANGLHAISWNVFDDGARGAGIGSRYFMVANGVTNQPEAASHLRSVARERGAVEIKRRGDSGVSMRRGLNTSLEHVAPNKEGIFEVTAQQMDLIELHLGNVHDGVMRLAHGTDALPLGSTLDPDTGVFYWDITSPFFGTIDLEFTGDDAASAPVRVRVTIAPKTFE